MLNDEWKKIVVDGNRLESLLLSLPCPNIRYNLS